MQTALAGFALTVPSVEIAAPPHEIRPAGVSGRPGSAPRFHGDPGSLTETPPERYFERREIKQAIAFAEAGGIAVHRNFDTYHGRRSVRGFVMERPFLHVIGLRANLERWVKSHGIPVQAIQP